jgi:hypothetical protein
VGVGVLLGGGVGEGEHPGSFSVAPADTSVSGEFVAGLGGVAVVPAAQDSYRLLHRSSAGQRVEQAPGQCLLGWARARAHPGKPCHADVLFEVAHS